LCQVNLSGNVRQFHWWQLEPPEDVKDRKMNLKKGLGVIKDKQEGIKIGSGS
jgi:hypothetical protein